VRFDPGLQPERTALSWHRTSLSVVVGGIAGLKVLPGLLGAAGFGVGLAVVVAGAWLGLVSHRRTQHGLRVLVSGHGTLPDGGLLLVVGAVVSVVAAASLAVVIRLAVTS
jgi:putative membrane protein